MPTLAEAQATLAAAQTAYNAALSGKAASYGGRAVTYHDLPDLQQAVTLAQRQVNALQAAAAGSSNPDIVTPKWS